MGCFYSFWSYFNSESGVKILGTGKSLLVQDNSFFGVILTPQYLGISIVVMVMLKIMMMMMTMMMLMMKRLAQALPYAKPGLSDLLIFHTYLQFEERI